MKINVSVFDKGKFNIIKLYQYYKELNEIINNNLEINDFDLCNNYFDYYLIMKNSDNPFIKFVDKSMIYAKDFNNTLNNAKKIVTDRIGLENYNRLYLGNINKLRIELQELESSKSSSINEDWIKKFKDKKEVDVIDRNIVIEFIDNIYVYEDGNIKIVFKNNDEYL